MNESVAHAIMVANDGWTPVKQGLPPVGEVVAVTCQPKNGVRSWNRAYRDENCFWHGSGSMSNVIAWKRIRPWEG